MRKLLLAFLLLSSFAYGQGTLSKKGTLTKKNFEIHGVKIETMKIKYFITSMATHTDGAPPPPEKLGMPRGNFGVSYYSERSVSLAGCAPQLFIKIKWQDPRDKKIYYGWINTHRAPTFSDSGKDFPPEIFAGEITGAPSGQEYAFLIQTNPDENASFWEESIARKAFRNGEVVDFALITNPICGSSTTKRNNDIREKIESNLNDINNEIDDIYAQLSERQKTYYTTNLASIRAFNDKEKKYEELQKMKAKMEESLASDRKEANNEQANKNLISEVESQIQKIKNPEERSRLQNKVNNYKNSDLKINYESTLISIKEEVQMSIRHEEEAEQRRLEETERIKEDDTRRIEAQKNEMDDLKKENNTDAVAAAALVTVGAAVLSKEITVSAENFWHQDAKGHTSLYLGISVLPAPLIANYSYSSEYNNGSSSSSAQTITQNATGYKVISSTGVGAGLLHEFYVGSNAGIGLHLDAGYHFVDWGNVINSIANLFGANTDDPNSTSTGDKETTTSKKAHFFVVGGGVKGFVGPHDGVRLIGEVSVSKYGGTHTYTRLSQYTGSMGDYNNTDEFHEGDINYTMQRAWLGIRLGDISDEDGVQTDIKIGKEFTPSQDFKKASPWLIGIDMLKPHRFAIGIYAGYGYFQSPGVSFSNKFNLGFKIARSFDWYK
mgnify:CR=1 FL=1